MNIKSCIKIILCFLVVTESYAQNKQVRSMNLVKFASTSQILITCHPSMLDHLMGNYEYLIENVNESINERSPEASHIVIAYCPIKTLREVISLFQKPNLKELMIGSKILINYEGVDKLSKLEVLTFSDSKFKLNSQFTRTLRNLKKLKHLRLFKIEGDLEDIQSLNTLTAFEFEPVGQQFSEIQIKNISELKGLSSLSVKYKNEVDITPLLKLKKLRTMNFNGSLVNEENKKILLKMKNLKKIEY